MAPGVSRFTYAKFMLIKNSALVLVRAMCRVFVIERRRF